MLSNRTRFAPLAALVLFSLSCAVTTPVAGPVDFASPLADQTVPNDPAVEAVRAQLVQYQ